MSDFTTTNATKTYLGIALATTTWDTILGLLVSQVTAAIKQFCEDNIEAADYVEDHDGYGQDEVVLNHRPVNSIAYVREDYARAFASATTIDTSLWACELAATNPDNPGILQFLYYAVPNGRKNLRISYNAGYAAIPADVVLACHMWIGHVFEQRKDRGLTNQSLGNRSYGLDLSAVPADVAAILTNYRTGVRSK